jgi:hypothetical protein
MKKMSPSCGQNDQLVRWFTEAQSKEVLHWPREKNPVEDKIDAMLDRI